MRPTSLTRISQSKKRREEVGNSSYTIQMPSLGDTSQANWDRYLSSINLSEWRGYHKTTGGGVTDAPSVECQGTGEDLVDTMRSLVALSASQALPEQYRHIWYAYWIAGLSQAAIGGLLRMPQAKVSVCLGKANKFVALRLAGKNPQPLRTRKRRTGVIVNLHAFGCLSDIAPSARWGAIGRHNRAAKDEE
jgi:DNA-directed RNA polymerase specialized sigma24 family protein